MLFSRKCDATDMIVLLYNQRKEEFIKQTLEEKRARGEIAGEVYAVHGCSFLACSQASPSFPWGESRNEPVFMK